MRYHWKNQKKFAFTIVDDTDGATVEKLRPVYDCLFQNGIITTKTVWMKPPRDYFPGESMENEAYREYVLELQSRGYEIAFHDVGSGTFTGAEVREGLEDFKRLFGSYPKMQINHGDNPSSVYWCGKRFSPILAKAYDFYKKKQGMYVQSQGDLPGTLSFWGDTCKEQIQYLRNRVFGELNLLKCDPYTPYRERSKDAYSNYWFSSSDAMTADLFVRLLSRKNIDKLVREGGCAIVYTHFGYGFTEKNGSLREDVRAAIEYLSSKDGWFAPASEILDVMLEQKGGQEYITNFQSFLLDVRWIAERIVRKIRDRV